MWWEPADEAETPVAREVERLLWLYRDHVADTRYIDHGRQLVWGIGSAQDSEGRWRHPLVLASYEALTAAGGPPSIGRYSWADLNGVLGRESGPVGELLRDWELNSDALVEIAGRPLPASRVDATDVVVEVQTRTQQATVGLPCTLTASGEPAFITAGHLVTSNKAKVEIGATGSGGLTWVTGEVVHWSDPITAGINGGYDYAVVRLDDKQDTIGPITHSGAQPAPTPPYQVLTVDVYGRTPAPVRRSGSVTAAIAQLGDATRQWLNCWQFASQLAMQQGDSGSVALGSAGPSANLVFGHFVGMSVMVGSPAVAGQRAAHQYVQDLRSCLAAGLDQHITI